MRQIAAAIAAALLVGCAQVAPAMRPGTAQDTSVDHTPEWVRRHQPARAAQPALPGLAGVVQASVTGRAASRPAAARGAWDASCQRLIAEARLVCSTIRRVNLGRGWEYVGVSIVGREGTPGRARVITANDWPSNARAATLRVDLTEPTHLTDQVNHDTLIQTMLHGDVVHISRYGWPNDLPFRSTIPLDGFRAALDELITAAEAAGFRMRPSA